MIQDKLKELGVLIEQNPTSPQVLVLAADIKKSCATAEEEKIVEDFVSIRLSKLAEDVEMLHDEAIKLQLGEISDMINLSYIARKYFKKSRAWLSQRINGNSVNGKPCRFTSAELDIFNDALRDMSAHLSCVTVKY